MRTNVKNRESEREIAIVCASDTAVSIVLEILKKKYGDHGEYGSGFF